MSSLKSLNCCCFEVRWFGNMKILRNMSASILVVSTDSYPPVETAAIGFFMYREDLVASLSTSIVRLLMSSVLLNYLFPIE